MQLLASAEAGGTLSVSAEKSDPAAHQDAWALEDAEAATTDAAADVELGKESAIEVMDLIDDSGWTSEEQAGGEAHTAVEGDVEIVSPGDKAVPDLDAMLTDQDCAVQLHTEIAAHTEHRPTTLAAEVCALDSTNAPGVQASAAACRSR